MEAGQQNASDAVTFAGVDEAGLGPLLGPLCFGYSVFRAPRSKADLWKSLESCVSAAPGNEGERFVVADSKVVFTRTDRGARRLESTALGFLALLDEKRRPPANGQAIAWESPRELAVEAATIAAHPWYASLEAALPRHQERGTLELAVERLWRTLRKQEVELIDAGVRVIPEQHLNASFAKSDNKSLSAWQELSPILRRVYERYADDGLRLSVDRQGGRSHYGSLLRELFPGSSVKVLRETAPLSAYVVAEKSGRRRMRVSFAERGEQSSFAVALGSCLAKYARELCMDAFNEGFARHDEKLAPTAGYTTDGRRWLGEAQAALASAGVEPSLLMRTR